MPHRAVESQAQHSSHRREFFRQSGWMMVAGIAGGFFTYAVHFLAKKMSPADYGLFGALMAATMCIPAMPVQMLFTQQTARALATGTERQLSGLVRAYFIGAVVLWALFCLVVVGFQKEIFYRWEVSNPAAVWIFLPVMLLSMLLPLFSGVLQGQQNFLWLGWGSLLSAMARFAIAALAILALGYGASGMMGGVLAGCIVGAALIAWPARKLLMTHAAPSKWRSVFSEAFPLMLGFAAFQFLFSADPIFAKAYVGAEEMGFYTSAGTLARALMWVVGPLAAVMFPRIVHSHASSQKTDLLEVVFIGTAILSILGAAALSLVGPYLVKFVYGARFVSPASQLLPWYAGAMVPLTLANVLLNNLLARARYRIVPVLCAIVVLYVGGLSFFHRDLVQILQVFGVSNTVLLCAAAWFTWGKGHNRPLIEPT